MLSTTVLSSERMGLTLPSAILKLFRECSFICTWGVGCHSCDVSPAVRESCEAEENTSDVDPSSHDGGCCSPKADIIQLYKGANLINDICKGHFLAWWCKSRNCKGRYGFFSYGIGEGPNLLYSQPGEGHSSFWHGKKLFHVASILYIQAKLPVKVNLDYLQVSKNLHIEKLT